MYSTSSCDVQYIVTWCTVHRLVMYSTSSRDVQCQRSGTPSLHVPHVTQCQASGVRHPLTSCSSCHMSHRVWLAGSYGSEGTQTEFPHFGCIRTVLTLQSLWATLFSFVSGNWINIRSPNPQITYCIFAVLFNETESLCIPKVMLIYPLTRNWTKHFLQLSQMFT